MKRGKHEIEYSGLAKYPEKHVVLVKRAIKHLKKIRKLIRRGWCQNAHARDRKGNGVGFDGGSAKYFSLYGAINRVCNFGWGVENDYVRNCLLRMTPWRYWSLMFYNDHKKRTKKDILDLINRTIRRLKLKL